MVESRSAPAAVVAFLSLSISTGCGEGWRGVSSSNGSTRPAGGRAPPAAPLPLSSDTLVFVREVGPGASEIRTLDVVTLRSTLLFEVADATMWAVSDLALSPDRTKVAFASHLGFDARRYPLEDGLPTESIWTVGVDGRRPTRIMAPLPDDRGAVACASDTTCEPEGMRCDFALQRCKSELFTRSVSEITWSPDQALIWFVYSDHHWEGAELVGGTTLGSLPVSGGAPRLHLANDACAQVTGPAPHPDDGSIAAVRSVCSAGGAQIVRYPGFPPAEASRVLDERDLDFFIDLSDLQWTPDGAGLVFGGYGGDLAFDTLVLLETSTGRLHRLFDAPANAWIEGWDVAPDGDRIAVCVGAHDDAGDPERDLVLLDLGTSPPSATTLTNDGRSCAPSW